MPRIILCRGVHRDEKVAYNLAGRVARRLKSEGMNLELLSLQGLHSFLENPPSDEREINQFVLRIQAGIGGGALNFVDGKELTDCVLIDFHNTRENFMNPDHVLPDYLPIFFRDQSCGISRKYEVYHYERGVIVPANYQKSGSSGIYVYKEPSDEGFSIRSEFTIEIPAVYVPYSESRLSHYERCLENFRRMRPDLKKGFDRLKRLYLTGYASIPKNSEKGYLNERMVLKLSALVKFLLTQ